MPHLGALIAGSSVVSFFRQCGGDLKSDSSTCLELMDDVTSDADLGRILRDYTVFAFVRNPFTRGASAYTYTNSKWRAKVIPPEALKLPYCNVTLEDFS